MLTVEICFSLEEMLIFKITQLVSYTASWARWKFNQVVDMHVRWLSLYKHRVCSPLLGWFDCCDSSLDITLYRACKKLIKKTFNESECSCRAPSWLFVLINGIARGTTAIINKQCPICLLPGATHCLSHASTTEMKNHIKTKTNNGQNR